MTVNTTRLAKPRTSVNMESRRGLTLLEAVNWYSGFRTVCRYTVKLGTSTHEPQRLFSSKHPHSPDRSMTWPSLSSRAGALLSTAHLERLVSSPPCFVLEGPQVTTGVVAMVLEVTSKGRLQSPADPLWAGLCPPVQLEIPWFFYDWQGISLWALLKYVFAYLLLWFSVHLAEQCASLLRNDTKFLIGLKALPSLHFCTVVWHTLSP